MMAEIPGPMTYEASGVNYGDLDPFKRAAQEQGRTTAGHLAAYHGMREVPESRGESAYVWDRGDEYGAMVTEGLGTKNLIADAYREEVGPTYYDAIAQDTAAMILNDLTVVGARPEVVTMHLSVGESSWFHDTQRAEDLARGFARACDLAMATWGGGETPTLRGIIVPGASELSGSAFGSIRNGREPILGKDIAPGDAIVVIKSSGMHANGATLARDVANVLDVSGYKTKLSDGREFGAALLTPTTIYAPAVETMQQAGLDIHYMSNITGHGWRKIMRATKPLSYHIEELPIPQDEFRLIQEISGNDDKEMYGNLNMGGGYAIYLPANQALDCIQLLNDIGFEAIYAGEVAEGDKAVHLEPLGITYHENELEVR
ncbi:MAG TPA: AIR synthase-related protein [Candidatus Saccharibacteria bacterium]|nr:AIR synthase-related protein [Candidatus Saccharibacteria bacterium]HRK94119.1 AIR synthase-related protein [Candidatus Saccharibacteria bacterium]